MPTTTAWKKPTTPPPVKWTTRRTHELTAAEYKKLWRWLGFKTAPVTDTDTDELDRRIRAAGLPPLPGEPEEDPAPPPPAPERKSRAKPTPTGLTPATAASLADELTANGWTRYDDADAEQQASTGTGGMYEVRSFWTMESADASGAAIRPEPWIRKRAAADRTQGPYTTLNTTLNRAGWIRAADAPASLVDDAEASPEWQTATYTTADNPATNYYDPKPEQWIRPVTTSAILQYNALALNDAADTMTDAAIEDEPPPQASPAARSAAPTTTRKHTATPATRPGGTTTTTSALQRQADTALAGIAKSLLPKAVTKVGTAKAGTTSALKKAATTQLAKTTNTIVSKATNLLTGTLRSQAQKLATDTFIKQNPAPVSTGRAVMNSATNELPLTETAPLESAPLSTGADAAAAAIENTAPPGFHFQTVTSASGAEATIAVPDTVAAVDGAAPLSEIASAIADAGDVAYDVGAALIDNPAIFGGADVAASELAGAAAADAVGELAIADFIPYVGAAFAVYGLGRALGLWGPSGLYAHTTGMHVVGTLTPSGFQGDVRGMSSNGKDNYEFPQTNAVDLVRQISDRVPGYYTRDGLKGSVPIDLYASEQFLNDLDTLVPKIAKDPAAYMRAYAIAHAPPPEPDGDSHGQGGGD